ncbi:MAG: hypothetical protein B6D45_07035 [Ignavibacteriales bacterium UTCHB3]|nr:MAG: hypothetical protein B6D45_07035 [Ignavibacteriales bacterium UTCHB3]
MRKFKYVEIFNSSKISLLRFSTLCFSKMKKVVESSDSRNSSWKSMEKVFRSIYFCSRFIF